MLNFPSHVEEYGQWLSIHLSWKMLHTAPRYSLRYHDASNNIQMGSGRLGGSLRTLSVLLHRFGAPFRLQDRHEELSQIDEALLQEVLADHATMHLAHHLRATVGAFQRHASSSPLPLFVSTDFTSSVEAFAWIVYGVIASTAELSEQLEVIVKPVGRRTTANATPHVFLPLKVACATDIAISLTLRLWYLSDPTIDAFALRFTSSPELLPNVPDVDVTIGDASNADEQSLARWLRANESKGKLRILVNAPMALDVIGRHVQGVATISVMRGFADPVEVVRDVLNEVIHDKPLHLAVAFARRHDRPRQEQASIVDKIRTWLHGPRLYADPNVNEWFRLSKTLGYVSRVAGRPFALSQGAHIAEFAERLKRHTSSPIAEQLQASISELDKASSQLRSAFATPVYFDRESTGLRPIAEVLAAHDALMRSELEHINAVREVLQDERVADALEKSQGRRVDAVMLVLPEHGVPYAVDHRSTLTPDSLVRLAVHIGQRSEYSLIVGETPVLDPLLPPLEGELQHQLDFVVYPKDFSLISGAALQTGALPRFGGTRTISWDLRVPQVATLNSDKVPSAELRFSVYFRNQLLQSFQLTAALWTAASWQEATGVKIVCDFSQTQRFGELDALGDRILSLALNDSANGKHTLMVKDGDKPPITIEWNEMQLAAQTKALRNTLQNAMFRDERIRFGFDKDTLQVRADTESSRDFDAVVRDMARAGNALNTQLILKHARTKEVLAMFRTVLTQKDKTVQIVLLSADYALPWPLLYDYDIPATTPETLLPVCRGVDSAGRPCDCNPRASKGICLRGFWGFRHIIEQLAPAPVSDPKIPGLIAKAPTTPTLGMLCTISDPFVDALPKNLSALPLLTKVEYPNCTRALFDIIKEYGGRPPVMLYVGHQSGGGEQSSGPMLISSDKYPMLQLSDISKALLDDASWEEPRSLVLLMGCGTATTRVDTGFSLSAALLQLGAIGVVGTECDVATPIASRMARDLVVALMASKTIGEALKETTWNLAQQGCPVGLAFSYIGPVDARLPSQTGSGC